MDPITKIQIDYICFLNSTSRQSKNFLSPIFVHKFSYPVDHLEMGFKKQQNNFFSKISKVVDLVSEKTLECDLDLLFVLTMKRPIENLEAMTKQK